MRKFAVILLSIITSIMVLSGFSNNEVNATDEDFINYKYDFSAFRSSVSEWLDDYNPHSAAPIEGEIKLLKAFYLTEYSSSDDKYYQDKSDVRVYVPVLCNDKVIAVVSTYSSDMYRMPSKIYPISQCAGDYENGLSFFRVRGSDRDGDFFGGSYEFDIFTVNNENTVHLAYFEVISRNADNKQRMWAENTRAALKDIPEYRLISKMNHIDSYTESIYSFNYKYNGKNAVPDDRRYYIHNRDGKYLSYSNGKYCMTERKMTAFVITDNKDGTFSISPENTDKRMSVKGTDSFLINLSYFDGYCYSVSKVDDLSSMMRAKDSNVTFSKTGPSMIWNTSYDWYIEKV